jgi:bifunctional DNA-binding transcriptional regulator/antitoxin component of YhaV-PrlF toxin-antitoxin module
LYNITPIPAYLRENRELNKNRRIEIDYQEDVILN